MIWPLVTSAVRLVIFLAVGLMIGLLLSELIEVIRAVFV
jgi:hypothetical protein